jgi:hypothetical protein
MISIQDADSPSNQIVELPQISSADLSANCNAVCAPVKFLGILGTAVHFRTLVVFNSNTQMLLWQFKSARSKNSTGAGATSSMSLSTAPKRMGKPKEGKLLTQHTGSPPGKRG